MNCRTIASVINKKTVALLSFLLILLFHSTPSYSRPVIVTISQTELPQGGVFKVQLFSDKSIKSSRFVLKKKNFQIFKDNQATANYQHRYANYIGISRKLAPKTYTLWVKLQFEDDSQFQNSYPITVVSANFRKEHITLSKKKSSLQRDYTGLNTENREMGKRYRRNSKALHLDGPFVIPVKDARVTSPYGNTRVYNGVPSWSHSGIDLGKGLNAAILASNSGRVVLVRNYKIHGKTILIDHGWGIISSYTHLNTILVNHNDFVKKGQLIGKMGSTGISTGPHLHWGLSIQGVKVNPQSFPEL